MSFSIKYFVKKVNIMLNICHFKFVKYILSIKNNKNNRKMNNIRKIFFSFLS